MNSEASETAIDMFNINSQSKTKDDSANTKTVPNRKRLERATVYMLITLGCVAGIVNGLIILGNAALGSFQASVIDKYRSNYGVGLFLFMLTTSIFVLLAACLCKYVSSTAAGILFISYLLAYD